MLIIVRDECEFILLCITLVHFPTFLLEIGFFLKFTQWGPDQLGPVLIQLDSQLLPQLWHIRLIPRPDIYPSGGTEADRCERTGWTSDFSSA